MLTSYSSLTVEVSPNIQSTSHWCAGDSRDILSSWHTVNARLLHIYILLIYTNIRDTHHHFGTAAEAYPVVVGGNNLKLEIGPAHISKHHGRLDDARVGLDDEAVLALRRGWDNQAVRHGAVIPGVLVSGLLHTHDAHKHTIRQGNVRVKYWKQLEQLEG